VLNRPAAVITGNERIRDPCGDRAKSIGRNAAWSPLPLIPSPSREGTGAVSLRGSVSWTGRAMPLVSRSPNRIVRVCRCDRLRCGRRMHRPYGCRVRGVGCGFNGQDEVNRPKRGVVAPLLDILPVRGGDGCCFFAGGGVLDVPGDASRGTIAEPYREGLPLRSSVLRPTDASPLRVPGSGRRLWIQRDGRCLSCDERRIVSSGRAVVIVCAAADGCIAPTGAGFGAKAADATGRAMAS